MINTSLQVFAVTLIGAGRIQSVDLKRLQRDILPHGISSREEAELLLRLDQSVSQTDRSFSDWLVAAMVDFVVWGTRPTGSIDTGTARWLARALVGDRGPTGTALLIAREIVREAQDVDEGFLSLVLSNARRHPQLGAWRVSPGRFPHAA